MIKKKIIMAVATTALLLLTMGVTAETHADQVVSDGKTYHVVEKGDTLSDIGFKYGLDYKDIFKDNQDIIDDVNLIFVCQKLLLKDLNGEKVEVNQQTHVEETYVAEEVYVPEETYVEEVYVEETYVEQAPTQSYGNGIPQSGSGMLNPVDGVNYFNGVRETYYSQNVLAGGGLNISGRHVGDYQTVRDGDGYIVVASDVHAKGSIVQTSLGTGKVYDTGVGHSGVDIYTNW